MGIVGGSPGSAGQELPVVPRRKTAPIAPFQAVRESRVAVPFSPPKQVVPTIREVLAVERSRREDRRPELDLRSSILDLVSDSGGGWS
jgi:hypothetical protein